MRASKRCAVGALVVLTVQATGLLSIEGWSKQVLLNVSPLRMKSGYEQLPAAFIATSTPDEANYAVSRPSNQ